MTQFFVSYTQADTRWAEWIAWQLEDAGHEVILQAWDFPPGSNFVHEMHVAAEQADRTVVVLSPDYLESKFAASEWYAAFRLDPTAADRRLLPVRVSRCDISGLLGPIVYVDLVNKDEEASREALLRAAGNAGRAKPEIPPLFPGQDASNSPEKIYSVTAPPAFPGTLPQHWNIPHERNPDFSGRDDLFDRLAQTFERGVEAAVVDIERSTRATLHGLGGVGKTQLAVEYAHRHKREYDLVWWLRSDEPATLAGDYADLASELGLVEAESSDQALAIAAVRRWLEQGGCRWLLVFDNVDEFGVLSEYYPQRGGHVLATSRNRQWPRTVQRIEVDVLDPNEAAQFLMRRTDQNDLQAAELLAEELGYLPLALAQAGAYTDEVGLSLAAYIERYRSHRVELLRRGKPDDYPFTVATTWELSFKAASEKARSAEGLLNLLAFLAPEEIPLDLILPHYDELPQPWASALSDRIAVDEAVAAMRRYSLVEVTEGVVTIHRLVQFVSQERLSIDERKAWAAAVARAVNAAFPVDAHDVRWWPAAMRLLPHALAVGRHIEGDDSEREIAGHLFNRVGRYLSGRALYRQARESLETALTVRTAVHGSEHPDVAMAMNDLAVVANQLGELEQARSLHERALAIREAVLGSDHPHVATSLGNLAGVLRVQGELEQARSLHERALVILSNHARPSLEANIRRQLADIDLQQGRVSPAILQLRKALEIDHSLGRYREKAEDLAGLASAAGMVGRRSAQKVFLVIRWLILDSINDPSVIQARRHAESTFPLSQRHRFDKHIASIEADYHRDGGWRLVNQTIRRI
jgi:tetratricopeptide (TPR) repeat protein